jgi:hypothetical protein
MEPDDVVALYMEMALELGFGVDDNITKAQDDRLIEKARNIAHEELGPW